MIDNVGINPTYDSASATELFRLLWTALGRIGGHPDILAELPALLASLGFVDFARRETAQDHPAVCHTPQEYMQLRAAGLGAIYNAKPLIAKVLGVPMDHLNALFVEMTNDMMQAIWTEVTPIFGVVTARKPDTAESTP